MSGKLFQEIFCKFHFLGVLGIVDYRFLFGSVLVANSKSRIIFSGPKGVDSLAKSDFRKTRSWNLYRPKRRDVTREVLV